MSGSITMSVLRQENGKQYGNWVAREVTGTFAAPRLVAECQTCSHKQQFNINDWYLVTKGRTIQCANFSGHRAETKAVPQAQPLSLEILNKMPADEYKRRMLHEPGFEEAANAILNAGPKQLNYREAQEQKSAREKAARMAPQRVLFTNAYHAYEAAGEVAPTFDQWLALDNQTRQSIIDRFDLTRVDYKKEADGRLVRREVLVDAMDLYRENLRKMGLDDPAPEAQPVPARRVEPPLTTPAPVQPETVTEHVAQLERFAANAQERLYKVEHTGVRDPRIADLEQRVAALENMIRPALAPATKLSKIQVQWAMIQGKTEYTFEQFRCFPKERREQIVQEAANG